MNELNLQPELKAYLEEFTRQVKEQTQSNLKAIVLYGGAAKNDFTLHKSNVNLFMVFEQVTLTTLDGLALIFQKAMSDFRMAPFIVTTSEIEPAADVFAVKLFDIQHYHVLLAGTDFLTQLSFDPKNLRFISEQELRNLLARMKHFYLLHFNMPEQLINKVQTAFTSLIVNANTCLYLKTGKYYASRKEIIQHLKEEKIIGAAELELLLRIRETPETCSREEIRNAYEVLMLQCKHIIKLYKSL